MRGLAKNSKNFQPLGSSKTSYFIRIFGILTCDARIFIRKYYGGFPIGLAGCGIWLFSGSCSRLEPKTGAGSGNFSCEWEREFGLFLVFYRTTLSFHAQPDKVWVES